MIFQFIELISTKKPLNQHCLCECILCKLIYNLLACGSYIDIDNLKILDNIIPDKYFN